MPTIIIPVTMPPLGESIAEATVVRFLVEPGTAVKSGEDILEVETNKAVLNVVAPEDGMLVEFVIGEGQSCPVGMVVARLAVESSEAAVPSPTSTNEGSTTSNEAGLDEVAPEAASAQPLRTSSEVKPTISHLPVPAVVGRGASFLSPRMRARIEELGLHAADLAGIAGSGAGGRVTVEDFERFIADLEKHTTSSASPMRVAVADAMRRSSTRPLATVGLIVNIDPMLGHRKSADPKPGPALYAMRALALALAEDSRPAGRLIGQRIAHPRSLDIGFAVEVPDGVLVPVIRNVHERPLSSLVAEYLHLVEQAREGRLPRDNHGGGIATVTNYGTFGLDWATPIPLPEQTLVLGMGAGRPQPWWNKETGAFGPVTQAQFTLSFDHRVLDGGGAGRLLQRVAALLSTPDVL